MESTAQKNQFRYVALVLLIGTFAAYSFVLRASFINYDDIDYATENQHVKNGLTLGGIAWAFTTGFSSNWHPLTWISLMLDSQLYGLRSGGFHFTNLLLHMANALLLLTVMNKMTGAFWRSAFVAALFAWHPLHVESVAWVAERKDVLSGLFWLLTMLFYLRYAEAAKAKTPQAKKWYGLTLLFFACGLMAKPMVVTLPFVLLLLDYWPLRRIADRGLRIAELGAGIAKASGYISLNRAILEKIPFFALALASSVATFAVQKAGGAVAPLKIIPLHERIANALVAYATYLRKMFWPDDLAVFYPLQHHLPAWQWISAGLLLAAISTFTITQAKKRPYLAVGWLWYLGTLVPVIGLVQVGEQSLADRYTYLPLIGVFIMLAWGVADLTQPWPGKILMLKLGAASVLLCCLVLTAVQADYWRDSVSLFSHALAVTKNNTVAHNNLGAAYDKLGRFEDAKAEFVKALQIDPESPGTLNGLGEIYAHGGESGKAVEFLNAALAKRPFYSDAHYNLGNVLAAEGKYAEAVEQYQAAIRAKPYSADAHNNLGAMWMHLGKLNEAEDEFKTALNILPEFPEAHAQLGSALMKQGQPEAARAHYAEAVRLKPDFVPARLKLGLLLAQQNDLEAAITQFLAVIKLEPTNAAAYYNLGAAFAARRDLDGAAKNFARAASLDPKDADARGRLAAVLNVEGKPAEAANAYRDALRVRPDWPVAMRDLAWLLATSSRAGLRNGDEAIKLAERANALLPKADPRYLETLDVAYAEAGRFDDAIKTAEKVRQLCTNEPQKIIADRAGKRLELYKAGKPYHETGP